MEVTCSSETSADFQRTTGFYIPEDRTLHLKMESAWDIQQYWIKNYCFTVSNNMIKDYIFSVSQTYSYIKYLRRGKL
jgi:hypothetical protein